MSTISGVFEGSVTTNYFYRDHACLILTSSRKLGFLISYSESMAMNSQLNVCWVVCVYRQTDRAAYEVAITFFRRKPI